MSLSMIYNKDTILQDDSAVLAWLQVEREIDREWELIQQRTVSDSLRRQQRVGNGMKESNILTVNPYEENRVVLAKLGLAEEEDETFINASYVREHRESFEREHPSSWDSSLQNPFILAAMPHNDSSRRDFWRFFF